MMNLLKKLKNHNPVLTPKQVRARSPILIFLGLALNAIYWYGRFSHPQELRELMQYLFGWFVFWILPVLFVWFGIKMTITGKLPARKSTNAKTNL